MSLRIKIMDMDDPSSIEKAEDEFVRASREGTRDDRIQAIMALAEIRLIALMTNNFQDKAFHPEDIASSLHALAGIYSNVMAGVPPTHKAMMVTLFTQAVVKNDAIREYHLSLNGDK